MPGPPLCERDPWRTRARLLRLEGSSHRDKEVLMNEPASDALILRRSDVDSYGLCPKRIELRDRIKRRSSEALIVGQAVHGAIELILTEGARPTHKLMRLCADKVLMEEYDSTLLADAGTRQKANEFEAETYAAVRAWCKTVKPELDPAVAVEEKMRALVEVMPSGRELWITGIPDYVTETELVDWKTAYRMWSEPKMYTTTQPMVYAWLTEQTMDHEYRHFRYWIWSRSAGEWKTMARSITGEEILAAMELVRQVGRAMDAGIYPAHPFSNNGNRPRGWWCSPRYCDAWDVCTAKHLITDPIVNDPSVSGWG